MGKSLPFAAKVQELPNISTSCDKAPLKPKVVKPIISRPPSQVPVESGRVKLTKMEEMESSRGFQDTLKEAKAGDISMQVLVGQMYYSGYGVPRDSQRGRAWISRASRSRSSAWKVSDKHPGYNASDSDSDGPKCDIK